MKKVTLISLLAFVATPTHAASPRGIDVTHVSNVLATVAGSPGIPGLAGTLQSFDIELPLNLSAYAIGNGQFKINLNGLQVKGLPNSLQSNALMQIDSENPGPGQFMTIRGMLSATGGFDPSQGWDIEAKVNCTVNGQSGICGIQSGVGKTFAADVCAKGVSGCDTVEFIVAGQATQINSAIFKTPTYTVYPVY